MINQILQKSEFINTVLIFFICAVGIMFTKGTKFVQIFHLPKAFKYAIKDDSAAVGEISGFASLCTLLAANIGTGNIVGVAAAVCTGGPGSIFWMIVSAFLGMATIYAEGLLAVKYRQVEKDGTISGGPFHYIEKGMGKRFKPLAVLFALFGMLAGLLGIGTVAQINGVTSAVKDFFDPNNINIVCLFGSEYSLSVVISGAIIGGSAGLVIMGGVRRIARVSEVVVPFMAVLYTLFVIVLILCNIEKLPSAISVIIEGAFNPSAVTGGVVGSMLTSLCTGVSKGIFSNEAGLGSAAIVAAGARVDSPARQGLVCMLGTFIDTIVMCTLTGLAIVITGAWQIPSLEGAAVTSYAFSCGLPFPPKVSSFVLMLSLVFFAFTSMLGWNYYSKKCLRYLIGNKKMPLRIFNFLYVLAIFAGPYLKIDTVWKIAELFNSLMAIPNLIALTLLSDRVFCATKDFLVQNKRKKQKFFKL